jgi:polyhydroxybutyrate depolymerase
MAARIKIILALGSLATLFALPHETRADEPAPTKFIVDGTQRETLIFAPSANNASAPAPVVFAFHGHGGNMHNAARKFDFQSLWPEAIVVYMQGLPTPSKIDPDGKQPGWQHYSGQLGDRDLKFFDAVLASLRKNYKVDDRRIYATGFSNGGAFTYCLWANRPNTFAALAPMAGLPWPTEPPAVPKPAFIVAGENDKLVPIEDQQTTIRRICELDQATTSKPQPQSDGTTLYESSINAPVVTLIHPGGHMIPPVAPQLVVDFFRSHGRMK